MKNFFFGFVILTTLLTSCEEEDLSLATTMVYAQTQCADPWDTQTVLPWIDENDVLVRLELYLANEGVDLLTEPQMFGNGEIAVCLACSCPSGFSFEIQVNESDISTLEAMGWQKN